MNSVRLVVTDQVPNGSYHTKLFLDEQESGILYLTPEQFLKVSQCFKSFCYENSLSFDIENPFDIDLNDDDELDEFE